ncbi:MAG: M15 family metallopeptidase [Myxococcales bacterium]|nr:M15 family metallopeptidase [Myxococcales bacterium]
MRGAAFALAIVAGCRPGGRAPASRVEVVALDAAVTGPPPSLAVDDAPPVDAPLVDAPPVDAPPVDAPPVDAPPVAPTPAGWIDIAVAIPDAVLDVRYATAHNLTGAPLYPVARCWLRPGPAARLVVAADALRRAGHRLLLWDCYRPASVQLELWARVPDPRFVARPRFDDAGRPIAGSVHSRGGAIDVSLADLDGRPRVMPTDHDDFSAAASGGAATGEAKVNLAALRQAMATAGWKSIRSEWWHFEARGAGAAPLADEPLR